MTTASPTPPVAPTSAPPAAPSPTSTTSPAAPAPVTPGSPQAAASGTEPPATPPSPTPPVTPAPPADPARVVPDTYTLTVPEGNLLDQEDVQAIAAIAKAHQWTNEEAQAALEESHTQLHAQRSRLHDRLLVHPEVGGERLEQAQQAAFRVLDRFLPAGEADGIELRRYLNKTGYGDWAPIVVLLSRVGKAMGEDSAVVRDVTQTPKEVDPVAVLYGKKT